MRRRRLSLKAHRPSTSRLHREAKFLDQSRHTPSACRGVHARTALLRYRAILGQLPSEFSGNRRAGRGRP